MQGGGVHVEWKLFEGRRERRDCSGKRWRQQVLSSLGVPFFNLPADGLLPAVLGLAESWPPSRPPLMFRGMGT